MTEPSKNPVVEIESTPPAKLIMEAVTKDTDLEKLKGVLELQIEYEKNEARKAYHVAMSEFKKNPPTIEKDKQVQYSSTKYSHASLANVVRTITKELSKHGLSASWNTKQNGNIIVTCKITHVLGHTEETSLQAPSDSSGAKNAIQAIGSTITYLERYTLLAALGLATSDQDDDGQGTEDVEKIDESQVSNILDQFTELDVDQDKFFEYMGVSTVEDILKSDYDKAQKVLEAKRKRKKEGKKDADTKS